MRHLTTFDDIWHEELPFAANQSHSVTPGPDFQERPAAGTNSAWLDVDLVRQLVELARRGDVTTVLTPAGPLTAADRCDRCGAQAYLRVVLISGGELLFCAHHGRKFESELKKIAAEIQDETGRLTQTPVSADNDER